MLDKLIHRPIAVTAALLITVVIGAVSIKKLPVSLIPDIEIPYITVQFTAPDMSARELASGAVRIVCDQLIQTGGLENIEVESADGTATIKLSMSHKANMDYALIEVNERIDKCMSGLGDISRPSVTKSKASDIPAFYINLSLKTDSALSFDQLNDYVKNVIYRRLEQLDEIAMVDASGYDSKEILITPDGSKLHALGIRQSAFDAAILQSDINLNSLSIIDGYYRYTVKFASKISSVQDIKNIRLKVNNTVYKLEELAKVEMTSAKSLGATRINGARSIQLAVIKQSESKMSSLKSAVAKLIDEFKLTYPDITFTISQDQTHLLEYTIDNLIKNIIAGILIASLIIFLFMKDLRSSALICLTMPLSLIFSMGIFYLIGLSLNIISLSGLLLGIGMMADNTIILIDNITSRLSQNEDVPQAVVNGTKEVTGPMLSSVLTTCAVFIPLIFLSGIAGKLFYDQAIAITIVLLTSYIITITVIPVYYNWWFSRKPIRTEPDKNPDSKEGLTLWFMHRPALAWSILAFSIIGIILCFKYMDKEKLPRLTCTDTMLRINWNEQIGLDENSSRIKDLEELLEHSNVQMTSQIGVQNFMLNHNSRLSPNECEIYISADSQHKLDQIKEVLSDYLKMNYPQCISEFRPAANILEAALSDSQAPLVAKISLSHNEDMSQIQELVNHLNEADPAVGISEIQNKQDIQLTAKADLMALYGISYPELAACLKNALGENTLFTISQGNTSIPVVTGTGMTSLEDILNSTFIRKDGISIPISCLVERKNIRDFKTIYSDATGNYYPIELDIPGSKVMQTIELIGKEAGHMNVRYGGAYFTNARMISELILILLIAIILLYLILACQFESLLQPILILSEIGIDILFSLVALWICRVSINLMSMIGLVVVCGIVINDSILKVDCINKLRSSGIPTKEAVLTAGRKRKKAIIMTSLTTIFAILPFMQKGNMGADLQFPLMLVIVAGLSIGTLVSLYILPALYCSIYGRKDRA